MTVVRTAEGDLDVSRFSALAKGSVGPLWWGMVFLVTIEMMVFATFITAYLYLRFMAPEWPPAGAGVPDLFLPTLNTGVLLASSLAVFWGDKGIKKGDVMRLRLGIGLAASLAILFLVLKVVEYSGVGYYWDSNAYGSVVWTIIGFHSLHVLSVLLKAMAVLGLSFRGYWTDQRHLGVTLNGLYWHFVVVIWIPVYIVLYWVVRL